MAGNLVEILIVGKNMSREAFREVQADGFSMGGVLKSVGIVGAEALVAIGVESVKMASEYQLSTTRLVTSASEQRKNLKLVQNGMLDMAGQVGISAQHLSEAMYYVEAAGYHAADGLKVLRAAAQGAVAENADVTDVSKALTDVLVDYHLKASAAADVTSKMIMAVAHGKVNLEDFSKAFASIVPAASAAGISFNDVGAALAQMTNHGFTAQRGAQNLAQALRSLLKPTTPMIKAFQEYGVSTDVLRQKLHGANGLTDAMEYLAQAATKAGKEGTPEFAAALRALMGTAPGANAAITTVGANMGATTDTIHAMAGATADASGKVAGFALVQQTFGQRIRELDAGFQSLLIRIGDKLMPVLSKFIDYVMTNGAPILSQLGDIAKQYVVPVLEQFWQILQNLYPVAVSVFQIIGGAGYGALVAVSTILKSVINPALIAFSGFLRDNQGVVQGVVAGYLAYKGALLGFRAAQLLVEGATKAVAAAQWLWNLAMDANPIFLTITGLALLGAGLYEAYKHSETFRKAVDSLAWSIGDELIGAVKNFLPVLKQFADFAMATIGSFIHMAATAFGWVPGIGGQLKSAARNFDQFQASVDSTFNQITVGAAHLQDSLDQAMKERTLKVQISDWEKNLQAATAQLRSVPASKRADLLANITDLQNKIAQAQGLLAGMHNKTIVVTYQAIVQGAAMPFASMNAHAAGGVISAAATGGARNGWALVGEQGPELVRLPGGSMVTPAGQTRSMLAGGGGAQRLEIEWVGGNAGDPLLEWIRHNIRIRGGNVQTVLGQGY